jgi:2,3-dihydroxybiphenyl 1,2-dioxygenase
MEMDIRGLGYVVLDVEDGEHVEAWRSYAGLLGAMVVPLADGIGVRIDDRPFRIAVRSTAGRNGLAAIGWELPDARALDQAADELAAASFEVRGAEPEECAARRVRGLLHTTDPGGFPVELFHGPILDHVPFVSPTAVSGFVTGDMGLGHIVLATSDLGGSIDFYTRVLGFRVSDYWRPGADDVVFTHCNPRHHSLALAGAPSSTMHHVMLEVRTLDDVGSTLDRLIDAGHPISAGLGKHTNDLMVSFYARTPSGFDVEYGCGGLRVDDAAWTVTEITKPSFWGHRSPVPG